MSFKGKGGVWEAPGLGGCEGGNCPPASAAPSQSSLWHKEKDAGSGLRGGREGAGPLLCWSSFPTSEQFPCQDLGKPVHLKPQESSSCSSLNHWVRKTRLVSPSEAIREHLTGPWCHREQCHRSEHRFTWGSSTLWAQLVSHMHHGCDLRMSQAQIPRLTGMTLCIGVCNIGLFAWIWADGNSLTQNLLAPV